MNLSRPGLYHAHAVSIGIAETGKNNLATCTALFKVYEELTDAGDWNPVEGDITGYFYLERRDGSINTVTIDALKAAFGWDGRDPFWLQDADLANHPVQIKVVDDEYNGKVRLKVAFVNPHGAAPGGEVPKATGDKRAALTNRFRQKLGIASPPAAKPPAAAEPDTPF